MFNLSFKYRIAFIIFVLESIMMAVVLLTTMDNFLVANQKQAQSTEQVVTDLLEDLSRTALFTDDYDDLQFYLEDLVNSQHIKRILLINTENNIVASNNIYELGQKKPALINTKEHIWQIQTIANSVENLGALAINFSYEALFTANRQALDFSIAVALTGMTFIALIGLMIGFLLTRKLDRLKVAAQKMSHGNYNIKTHLKGQDEIAIVGQAFDAMANTIEKNIEALHHAHDDLEQRIQIRTQELAIARDQALEANRIKSAFLANMSHELRTPLNAIIGYSELVTEDITELGPHTCLTDLNYIKDAGKHLLDIISDILDLSKIEANKVELQLEPVFIPSLINEVIATIKPAIDKNQNDFSICYDTPIETIQTDVLRLKQILINLLSNAAKFTQQGAITIHINSITDQQLQWIIFKISDTGIGIAPKHINQLFQAFSQVDISSTRKFGGTGLGLKISKEICHLLGGNIHIESTLGQGSTFLIKIPTQLPL